MADDETYEEAVRNALVYIKEWMETAKQLGRKILNLNPSCFMYSYDQRSDVIGYGFFA